ncbi:response regulator transcription factor [Gracilibacillus oryzae]|uniref:Response regulator transcription factor n=1 Tax=Gracilibacillus oryzae TaxID=1672701 RepID=A0A7C8GUY7_9BACI|nr:LytTR family DNA-binding domain-containing protein [Gracilibacillus oryzae]KAB8137737.1 response regulator transcription factor [Gracilibacillus oryzae]
MIRVLIIEDDQQVQTFLSKLFNELENEIQVSTTVSAAEAFQMAKEIPFDLLIVDIQLVDYKGTDLVQQIRSMEAYKYTPIIFETAIVTEELRAYREFKSYHYLIKPYTKDEALKVITDVIGYIQNTWKEDLSLRVEQKEFIFEYKYHEILFIESYGKKLVIHLYIDGKHQQEKISGYSLKRMKEMVQDGPFLQCHKSYIVNTDFIISIDKADNEVTVRHLNGKLPIGNKYREQVLRNG